MFAKGLPLRGAIRYGKYLIEKPAGYPFEIIIPVEMLGIETINWEV